VPTRRHEEELEEAGGGGHGGAAHPPAHLMVQRSAAAAEDQFLSISSRRGRARGGVGVEELGEVDHKRDSSGNEMDRA
jgi:hypothetical protein